ncbi:hypothetical protein DNX92_13490 [Salmonella enterica subsp. enterica]|nr:hypothetical protein [Salmonella enterica subsp. enterica serovar Richmond]
MHRWGALVLAGLLMSGCDAGRVTMTKVNSADGNTIKPVVSAVSDKLNDIEKMERCRRELEALKRIDIRVYNQRKAGFDTVMQSADIYSGVRSDVSASTQDAVDAYYRYRVDKMCADISNDVLQGLSSDSKK